jgi:hypothetical protein
MDRSQREYQLRNFPLESKADTDKRAAQAIGEQIQQDFSRILVLHNKIVRVISNDEPLDYDFVADAAEEIKKRATRLQGTLALRDSESQPAAEKPVALDHGQMKAALLTLCKQIKSFVTNPVIETPGTVNADELTRARHDLDSLIKLSGQLKKDADKLDKHKN